MKEQMTMTHQEKAKIVVTYLSEDGNDINE